MNEQVYPHQPTYASVSRSVVTVPGRTYRAIDFILPGQLGFSLLSAGVFGVAFVFYNLRQTLVLKRFFATPIKRSHILFGEALSRVTTLPQFLLTGTFFSIDNFPGWLQPFCKILPLTHLNNAMRNVAFEGDHLTDCLPQLGVLALWALAAYALAIRVFRWE